MRLVSQQLSEALSENQPVNFGLYFNKMLPYHADFSYLDMERKNGQEQKKGDKLTFKPCEGEVNGKRFRDEQYGPFRQHSSVYNKTKTSAANILKQRHLQQAGYCQEMEKAGWHHFIVHARLTAPFVSGLGMAHPTETGLVLDHTSGMPYIPASSQKGVLRLAHLVNTLCDEQGRWLPEDELVGKGIITRNKKGEWEWQEDAASTTLFGFGGDKKALAGQLILLDAYPLIPPELGEEILNPHYGDYYQKKTDRNGRQRGPTEDQSPVPIKFLVVRQGAEFVFRVLLRTPFAGAPYPPENRKALITLVERNLHSALTNEGMGAKTALGFGRFEIEAHSEPSAVIEWLRLHTQREENRKFPWRTFVRDIEKAADWGQLDQCLKKEGVKLYQRQPEVGAAIAKIAKTIQKNNPKKWDADRDTKIADWLRPSGIIWQMSSADTKAAVAPDLTDEELVIVTRIENLHDWGAWIQSGIVMEALPLPALNKLREKFSAWNIKNGKKDKPKVWKVLNQLLRELR